MIRQPGIGLSSYCSRKLCSAAFCAENWLSESTESGSTAQQLKRVLSPKRYREQMIISNAKNRSLLWILNQTALLRERSAIPHISSHHPVVSKNVQGP